ncbi:hypothetical protein [Vibrio clamense]
MLNKVGGTVWVFVMRNGSRQLVAVYAETQQVKGASVVMNNVN